MMGEQRRILSSTPRLMGMAIVLILLLLAGCGGPLPGSPRARAILSASDADRVNVLPDGRRILFWPQASPFGLMMLDLSTGGKVQISKDIDEAQWLDDGLLYGYQYTPDPVGEYYAINLRPQSVVRLETLAASAKSLPEYIREVDSIYAIVTGALNEKYLLLLLRLDADHRAVGGYAVYDVHSLDTLLAGHPYRTVPPEFPYPYDAFGEKYPSPDGLYYYTCHSPTYELAIYSQQGVLLNHVTLSSSAQFLTCYGWAWDSSGVFFQERGWGSFIGGVRIGPLQLLLVKP